MEMVKRPENKINLLFEQDYQAVYRIILQNSEACSSPQQFRANLFPDKKTATITQVAQDVIGYTLDIEAIAERRTQVALYLGFDVQKKFLPDRIVSWVNDGTTRCKFNGYPIFGPP